MEAWGHPAHHGANFFARFPSELLIDFTMLSPLHRHTASRELYKQKNAYKEVLHLPQVAKRGMWGEPVVDIGIEKDMGLLVSTYLANPFDNAHVENNVLTVNDELWKEYWSFVLGICRWVYKILEEWQIVERPGHKDDQVSNRRTMHRLNN